MGARTAREQGRVLEDALRERGFEVSDALTVAGDNDFVLVVDTERRRPHDFRAWFAVLRVRPNGRVVVESERERGAMVKVLRELGLGQWVESAEPKDLYAKLLAAGCEMGNHESDLHVRATPTARRIIEESGERHTFFTSNIDGKQWIEVPFKYTPYWTTKVIHGAHEKYRLAALTGGRLR